MRAKRYIMACVLFCTLLICGSTVIASAEENNEKNNGEYRYKEVERPYPYKVKVGDTYIECGDGICLVKYLGDEAEVVVPSEIDGKPVTVIGSGCFSGNQTITRVEIPESVTWLDGFNDCSNLADIKLSNGVKVIGVFSFENCGSLEKIDLPDSVTNMMSRAFEGCSSLKSIHLSKNLKTIYTGAFQNCSSLEEITIPAGVTNIGKMWMGKSGHVFSGCTSLKRVTINGKIQAVRRRTFEWCKALETIELPASVTKIGEGAFIGCKSLETIKLPSGVERICIDAFRGCGLKEITFPESLQMVGRRSFAHCESLKKIVIKGKNARIGSLAFKNIAKNAVFDVPNTAVNIYRSRLTKKNTGFVVKSMKVV